MVYPRCFSRLSAWEVVNTFASFTGRDSRKPSAVYGFKSETITFSALYRQRKHGLNFGIAKIQRYELCGDKCRKKQVLQNKKRGG